MMRHLLYYFIICLLTISILPSLKSQGTKDSILYYIQHEDLYDDHIYAERIMDFSNDIFSELNGEEVGNFYKEIESKVLAIDNILARAYLIEINCAYLNNSSDFEGAEQCCNQLITLGRTHNRSDIEAFGLHDLSYVYNHLGNYKGQINLLYEVMNIWEELDPSSEYLRYAVRQAGEAHAYLGQFDSSFYYMDQALALEDQYGDSSSLCNVYEKLSRIHLEKGDFQESINYGEKGLALAKALNTRVRVQTTLMYLGYSSFYLGRYQQAIEYELEALENYEGMRNSSTASVYVRLGRIYNSIGDFDQARRYLEEAIEIEKEISYDIGIAKAFVERAYTFIRTDQYNAALTDIEFAEKIFRAVDDQINLANVYRRWGEYYVTQNICDLALDVHNKAISILEKADKTSTLATSHLEKANILYNCSQESIAKEEATKGLKLLERTGDKKGIMDAHLFLYNIYKSENNLSQGLYHYEMYVSKLTELTEASEQQAIAEERARFKVEQIEEDNALIEAKNKLLQGRNTLYATLAGGLILIGLILSYFFNRLRKYSTQLESQNQKIESQNTDLVNLNKTKDRFFGIIAHDLRSPLAAFQGLGQQIRHYTHRDEPEQLTALSQQIEELSGRVNELLDNLLNWSLIQTNQIPYVPKNIVLNDEIDDVRDLLEPLARAKGIVINTKSQANIKAYADTRAVQTILRNLLSNALKFSHEGSTVTLTTEETAETILITVVDEGVGMNEAQLAQLLDINKKSTEGTKGEKGTGLGIILCHDLVSMNNGEMIINSTLDEGTKISFSLPKAS